MKEVKKHLITALVQNETGTLNRLTSLFRRRGFSLASMNAGDCEKVGFSRLTIVVNADEQMLRQCVRQLDRVMDVVEVEDLPQSESVMRELALVRVKSGPGQRGEIVEIANILGGRVAHLSQDRLTLEFTDEPERIEHMLRMLEPYGVEEVVRTGLVAMKAK